MAAEVMVVEMVEVQEEMEIHEEIHQEIVVQEDPTMDLVQE